MDEFIKELRDLCINEIIIGDLHMLLHADDTVVLSMHRDLFIKKCNSLVKLFNDKRLQLNMKKSGFMVINPKTTNDRTYIKLNSGWFKYVTSYTYLGVTISDTGLINQDIIQHAKDKKKSVYVKLANFVRNNEYAPISVKKKVLQSCLQASLLYGCETWGSSSITKIETLYRRAIKVVYGMNLNTPNEIVYMESGLIHLKSEIFKRQYKFWKKIQDDIKVPSAISNLYNLAIEKNTYFIRHYIKMHALFKDAQHCYNFHKDKFTEINIENMRKKAELSEINTMKDYITINKYMNKPTYLNSNIMERDRIILTKYRTGSHYLRINTGKHERLPQEKRLCRCKQTQTLKHVILECEQLKNIRHTGYPKTLEEFFHDENAPMILRNIESTLKLR